MKCSIALLLVVCACAQASLIGGLIGGKKGQKTSKKGSSNAVSVNDALDEFKFCADIIVGDACVDVRLKKEFVKDLDVRHETNIGKEPDVEACVDELCVVATIMKSKAYVLLVDKSITQLNVDPLRGLDMKECYLFNLLCVETSSDVLYNLIPEKLKSMKGKSIKDLAVRARVGPVSFNVQNVDKLAKPFIKYVMANKGLTKMLVPLVKNLLLSV